MSSNKPQLCRDGQACTEMHAQRLWEPGGCLVFVCLVPFPFFFFKEKIKQVDLSCDCEGCLGIVGWQDVLLGEAPESVPGPVHGLQRAGTGCGLSVLVMVPWDAWASVVGLPLATLALGVLPVVTPPLQSLCSAPGPTVPQCRGWGLTVGPWPFPPRPLCA